MSKLHSTNYDTIYNKFFLEKSSRIVPLKVKIECDFFFHCILMNYKCLLYYRQYGDQKHVRKVFSRALNATRDWPESIGQSWLSYERDQGSLDSFELAYDKIQTR